jgi:retinol dehydrogenase 14
LEKKIAIVTGANSGIGYITALEIAKTGAIVVLVCRNQTKGEQAKNQIIEKSKNTSVFLKILDLSSQSEVRKLADEIKQEYPVIDILINNAGVIMPEKQMSVDKIELTWAINHIAYFLLTTLLIDQLKAAESARIINVASQASWLGNINWEDINLAKKYDSMQAYAQSKLANIMFSNYLAEKLKDTKVTTNAVHPGAVGTNFGANMKGFIGWAFKWFGGLMRTPEKGAETSIWLALSSEIAGVTGQYFADKKPIRAKAIAYQQDALKRLWELSEQMTK